MDPSTPIYPVLLEIVFETTFCIAQGRLIRESLHLHPPGGITFSCKRVSAVETVAIWCSGC